MNKTTIDDKVDARPQEEIFKEWFSKGVKPWDIHSNPHTLKAYADFYDSQIDE